ncbi:2-oxoacid:acceptor oxidoreductase family protein [Aminobacter carboxidus]|uniref:2-oxoacid:acceptor oxidoreductase family protein n=1 Tax=Aminobacter carboxidus TaxID=376165 RepID=A0A8E1WIK1_9HYPH|nr:MULTISPECIES: 2-oxoacid:acceptor oxidoreductase family protein [Aminobacter carboxidus group]MBB6468554.1 2-oxoglutarate ferredoxin oxidoreductase subunit gamma [Aminobacter lissarensis]MBE1205045.1 2-oxoacid:acceptor oxidoreductase family protein [Aminobacter carboxidus]
MELDLFISGIGGQGIQLVGKSLALAAIRDGRHVMLAGEYGGHMRGGSSVGTVVIGARPLKALPILPHAGSAIAMSHLFWARVGSRLRPGSLVLAEATIAADLPCMDKHILVTLPATAIATEQGSRMAAGMVMLGAYAALTGAVKIDSAVAAMAEQIPAYRRQHIDANERAIRAGAAAVTPLTYKVDFDAQEARVA